MSRIFIDFLFKFFYFIVKDTRSNFFFFFKKKKFFHEMEKQYLWVGTAFISFLGKFKIPSQLNCHLYKYVTHINLSCSHLYYIKVYI